VPRKKQIKSLEDVFGGEALEIPILSSGEVVEILRIKPGRLERFLANYPLDAFQPKEGQGHRRLFRPDDVRRLGIAKRLLDDGFRPQFVADIVKHMRDERLIDYDEKGELYLGIFMSRHPQSDKRTFKFFHSHSGKPPSEESWYCALDFGDVITKIDQRITAALEKRRN
jgi:DNA-binding transcriptional MerR regulator